MSKSLQAKSNEFAHFFLKHICPFKYKFTEEFELHVFLGLLRDGAIVSWQTISFDTDTALEEALANFSSIVPENILILPDTVNGANFRMIFNKNNSPNT